MRLSIITRSTFFSGQTARIEMEAVTFAHEKQREHFMHLTNWRQILFFGITISMIVGPVYSKDGLSPVPETVDSGLAPLKTLIRQKRFEEAKDKLDVYIQKKPQAWAAYVLRSRCYADAGKFELSIKDLKAAEKLSPGSASIFSDEAQIYATMKDSDKAIVAATESLKRQKDNRDILHLRAMMYSAKGMHKKAIEDLNEYIKLMPSKHRAYMWRGNAYEADGNLAKALEDFSTGFKVSNDYEYRFHRARILQRQGRIKDAIAEMSIILKQNPEEDEAWNKRGSLNFQAGNYKDAVSDYTQALATSFGAHETLYRARARAYEKLGERAKAEADVKKANELLKKPVVQPI